MNLISDLVSLKNGGFKVYNPACRIHPLIVVVVFIRLAHCDLMVLNSQRPDIGLGYHVGMAAAEKDHLLTHAPFPYYLCIREHKNHFS